MQDRIVVTGIGIISALGIGKEQHVAAFKQSQSGLRYPKYLNTKYKNEFLLGEVDESNEELAARLHIDREEACTRTTLLSIAALQDLINSTGLDILKQERLAFINANTVGGMCSVEDMYLSFISPEVNKADTKYIDTLDCAESTQHAAEHFGLKPLVATISTACSSSGNALILGARMIKQGIVQRAVCGGCDSLSRFTLNGFHSLKNVSKSPSRPFDRDRNGLNLGEAAGYVLLEKEQDAIARGADIIAVLSGYANSNDAHHATAPSPDGAGAYATMQQALTMAGLQPADIDYINAHGTATLPNDSAEGQAIQRLFTDKAPYFSSTKPFTGHTLAAAGIIEAIFSIWAMKEQMVLPNLNFETLTEEITITPVKTLIENVPIKHVLSNSFGFGGNNVSLVFSNI